VTCANGDAAADGEVISFSIPSGAGTLSASTAETTGGVATVTYTAPSSVPQDGIALIAAESADGQIYTAISITLTGLETIDIQPRPALIEIAEGSPDPASIDVKGTGGQSTSLITFDVKDSRGNHVTDGYRIDFYIDSSPNGGEDILPTSALTTDGQVSTILRSGFKSGPVGIKAVYHHDTNISTTTCQVAINAGPPVGEEFGIFAEWLNISGLSMANLEDVIFVNAGDIYGNAILDKTSISFKTYNTGGFFEPGSAATLNGLASNNLHSSGTYTQPLEGFVSVTGETNNGGRTTHVTCLAVTPATTNVIYAGTDGGGVYKSTDSGATWTNISRSSTIQGQNWLDPYVNDIDVDPDNPNVVYAATGYLGRGNVYRSLDGGNTWNSDNTEEWKGVLSTEAVVLTVLCDDDSSDYVWAGTEGMGALYAPDGETFQWGGFVSTPIGSGDGTMSPPTLSATSRTEDWTATYVTPSASATVPEPGSDNAGNGAMSNIITDRSATLTETWTVTYAVSVGPVEGTGGGGLSAISLTRPNKASEIWTLTCVEIPSEAEPIFSVYTDAGFHYPRATVGEAYNENGLSFTISAGAVDFVENDSFEFTTNAYWQVSGSVSGAQVKTALTDVLYTSDFDEIAFTISEGGKPFEEGDSFTFITTGAAPAYWDIWGTVSGPQSSKAYNGITYTSDNDQVTFVISEGLTPFAEGDSFTFDVEESGLGHGKIVRDIVKVPSKSGNEAVLYAATPTGVFRSDNGGQTWEEPELEPKSFTGDYINCLALHPASDGGMNDIIYAGTEAAGVWVSVNSGQKWAAWNSGMGRGLSATTPVADPANKGNGAMSAVTVDDNTLSEYWTVRCTAAAADMGTFSVVGSVSGDQPNATAGTAYTLNNNMVSFTISDGTTDFEVNDSFRFTTTRDTAGTIKDLLVDDSNDRLYAITCFRGPLEPHAVGNLYVHDLDADDGSMTGAWEEANSGLPRFDPPDDTTLFAQHVMAPDIAGTPNALYIGGEGINLYKATTGLTSGSPAWNESKTGLTNLIMARMPILFSGRCNMRIIAEEPDALGNVTYTVYIEDVNGNPPIAGSTFKVTKTHITEVTLLEVTYPDCYTHKGTWRDRADTATNNPYTITTSVAREDPDKELKVEFIYNPTCGDSAPGCSGGDQELGYLY
jgi:hypothetical protein